MYFVHRTSDGSKICHIDAKDIVFLRDTTNKAQLAPRITAILDKRTNTCYAPTANSLIHLGAHGMHLYTCDNKEFLNRESTH